MIEMPKTRPGGQYGGPRCSIWAGATLVYHFVAQRILFTFFNSKNFSIPCPN